MEKLISQKISEKFSKKIASLFFVLLLLLGIASNFLSIQSFSIPKTSNITVLQASPLPNHEPRNGFHLRPAFVHLSHCVDAIGNSWNAQPIDQKSDLPVYTFSYLGVLPLDIEKPPSLS